MKLLPSDFSSSSVRWWVAAGFLVVVLAGSAGFLAAEFSAADVGAPYLPREKALVPAGAASAGAGPTVAAVPGPRVVRSSGNDAQDRLLMEQIWEVAIGAEAMAAAATVVPPTDLWRIGGVFESPTGPALIVVSGISGSPRYLSVGQLLPNKAEIVAITQDSVTVRTRINKRWVRVTLNV